MKGEDIMSYFKKKLIRLVAKNLDNILRILAILFLFNKRGTLYRGVKKELVNDVIHFTNSEKPIVVDSNKGRLVFVHGLPEKKCPFLIDGKKATEEKLASMVEPGCYTLISCFNAFHSDFEINGRIFKRDVSTIEKWPAIIVNFPFIGFVVFSHKIGMSLAKLFHPQYVQNIVEMEKYINSVNIE